MLSKDYAEKLVAEQCQIVEDKCKANIDQKQKEINDALHSKLDLLLGNQGLQSQRFDSMDQSIQQLNTTIQAQQLQIQAQESQIQGLITTIQAQQADIHESIQQLNTTTQAQLLQIQGQVLQIQGLNTTIQAQQADFQQLHQDLTLKDIELSEARSEITKLKQDVDKAQDIAKVLHLMYNVAMSGLAVNSFQRLLTSFLRQGAEVDRP